MNSAKLIVLREKRSINQSINQFICPFLHTIITHSYNKKILEQELSANPVGLFKESQSGQVLYKYDFNLKLRLCYRVHG